MNAPLHLVLVAISETLCEAFQEHFAGLEKITVVHGYFEAVQEFDCMVSPANSFGLMDGGVDAAITRYFGESLMHRVQERIIEEYLGEQPVGSSMIVETGNDKHPWLAHTPTMRIPMEIRYTDYVYVAMWAMLRAVHQHNKSGKHPIHTILCPGLGTGVGRVAPQEAARQMALAYRNYLNPPTYINWSFASERQTNVRSGGDWGFEMGKALEK